MVWLVYSHNNFGLRLLVTPYLFGIRGGCKERLVFILAVLISPSEWCAMPVATIARKVDEFSLEEFGWAAAPQAKEFIFGTELTRWCYTSDVPLGCWVWICFG